MPCALIGYFPDNHQLYCALYGRWQLKAKEVLTDHASYFQPCTITTSDYRPSVFSGTTRPECYYRKHFWWAIKDSNPKPIGYEPTALTSCANRPYLCTHYTPKVYGVNRFSIIFTIFYASSPHLSQFSTERLANNSIFFVFSPKRHSILLIISSGLTECPSLGDIKT